jgi:chaperone required for assembly of F1-ATPase
LRQEQLEEYDVMISEPPSASPKVPGREERSAIRRFYKTVAAELRGDGFAVTLDGRPVRTPGKAVLIVPTRGLAEAVAEEWRAQGETIEPLSMPLTRLSNTALDRVLGRETEIVDEIVKYVGSDLLCYRADHPGELVMRQAAAWDPVLAWARESQGVTLTLQTGLMPVAQPAETLQRVAGMLSGRSPFALCALHNMTTLTGSALLALAHAEGRLTPAAAWTAAHVDEDYQIAQWGEDAEAAARRARRWSEMEASARLLVLSAR